MPSPAPATVGSSPTQTGRARSAYLTTRFAGIHSAFPPSRDASSLVTRRVRARLETRRSRWSANRPARLGIYRPRPPRAHRGRHPSLRPRPGLVEASDASCRLGRKSPQPAQETRPSPGPLLGCTSGELVQQRLGLLHVGRVEALGEPAIDGHEHLVGFGSLAVLLPQPTQAHSGAQLQ
jgi:hypothetical protein